MFGGFGGPFNPHSRFMPQGFGMHGSGLGFNGFDEHYRAYSMAFMPSRNSREELNYGGKIILPQSAMLKLQSILETTPVIMFELINDNQPDKKTHGGVVEFTAEEGRVYLPRWMMQTLLLEEGELIQVKITTVPKGKLIKIQPQSVDFLDIHDPKAVLERAMRNYPTLTVGDMFTFEYNKKLYDIQVLECKPESPSKGISLIDTDLEVDFAPPVGYEENQKRLAEKSNMGSAGRAIKGGATTNIEEFVAKEEKKESFSAFAGSGKSLSGKAKPLTAASSNTSLGSGSGSGSAAVGAAIAAGQQQEQPGVPAALHLPPGRLYFGYPHVPSRKDKEEAEKAKAAGGNGSGNGSAMAVDWESLGGGQSLRDARKKGK